MTEETGIAPRKHRRTRPHKKAHQIGPFSRGSGLARLDLRTRHGRFVRDIESALIEHIGSPSAAEIMLIGLAARKALRLTLLTSHVLTKGDLDERGDREFLAYANSLRRDLETLGLKSPARQLPRLAEYIGEKTP